MNVRKDGSLTEKSYLIEWPARIHMALEAKNYIQTVLFVGVVLIFLTTHKHKKTENIERIRIDHSLGHGKLENTINKPVITDTSSTTTSTIHAPTIHAPTTNAPTTNAPTTNSPTTNTPTTQPIPAAEKQSNSQKQTPPKRYPEIIGLGVRKCGTGAFQTFFCEHPDILCTTDQREVHYWGGKFITRGYKWYLDHWPSKGRYGKLLFEKSPSYFHKWGAAANLNKVLGSGSNQVSGKNQSESKPKFIVILCDPEKRAYSDYTQRLQEVKLNHPLLRVESFPASVGRAVEDVGLELSKLKNQLDSPEANSTSDVILKSVKKFKVMFDPQVYMNTPRKSYVPDIISTGLYSSHLQEWFHYFDQSSFIFIDGSELTKNPNKVFPEVQSQLGLTPFFNSTSFKKDSESGFYCLKDPRVCAHSPGKGRTSSKAAKKSWKYQNDHKPGILKVLKRFYTEPNQELNKLLNRTFLWSKHRGEVS